MTADTDSDLGHTSLELMFAPAIYNYDVPDDRWGDWIAEVAGEEYIPPHTLFTTGIEPSEEDVDD